MALPPLKLDFPESHEFRDFVDTLTQKRCDHRPTTAREAFEWMKEICEKHQIRI